MKLYYYDAKHEFVIGELELGELTDNEMNIVDSVIEFFAEKNLLDGRYHAALLADGHRIVVEDGEPTLVFD